MGKGGRRDRREEGVCMNNGIGYIECIQITGHYSKCIQAPTH